VQFGLDGNRRALRRTSASVVGVDADHEHRRDRGRFAVEPHPSPRCQREMGRTIGSSHRAGEQRTNQPAAHTAGVILRIALYIASNERSDDSMQQYVGLDEDGRTQRRTVADALEVVRQRLGVDEITRAEIRLAPFALPWGGSTAAVVVLFPDLGYWVSLPASDRARANTGRQRQVFEIALLEGAEICPDGSALLKDGRRLRAVEVEPTGLHKPSALDERILWYVIALTESWHSYRNFREDLPQDLQHQVPDLYVLDYSRVLTINAPLLKVIQGYIEQNDPQLRVSGQKIADALARCGVRVPRRRPRKALQRARMPQFEL
jgi:hypothetical protein